tara:strand:+ start:9236 stop:9742 length:507 start_codon:yes stop_codon:yes gene_type:complete
MSKEKPSFSLLKLLNFSLILFLISCGYSLRTNSDLNQNVTYSIFFSESFLNSKLIDALKVSNKNKVYLNNIADDSEVIIKIIKHNITRYSAALGSGARTKEARLEYLLEISLKLKNSDKDMKYQIRNNKSYSFNESNILALEQEEEEITSDFINFALNEIKSLSLRLR